VTNQSKSPIETAAGIWRRRKWLLILPFTLLFIVIASLIVALPPLYKATSVVIFGQDDISESYVTSNPSNELEQRLEVVRQSISSRSHLQEVIDEFDLYPDLRKVISAEGVVNRLRKDITIEQQMLRQPQWGQNASFSVSISYQGWEPQLTADVTNALATRFQQQNEDIRTRQASRTAEFLRDQLDEVRTVFVQQERIIDEFKIANLGGLPQQESMNLATLERLNAELRLNGERQIQLMSRRNDLLLGLTDTRNLNAAAGASGTIRLARLKRELADLGTRFTDSYPEIIRVRGQILSLEREIATNGDIGESDEGSASYQQMLQSPEEIDREIINLKLDEEKLRASFLTLQNRIENTPKVELELQQLSNNYNSTREQYLNLQRLYQDAALAESLEYQQNQRVQVLEQAIPPGSSAAPDRIRLLILTFALAAGFSVALVFIAEQFDRTFHTLDDIRSFTKLPVLGSISRITTTREKIRKTLNFSLAAALFIGLLVMLSTAMYNYGLAQGHSIIWMMN
jgi:succinoglycan biosynthesis transport protein ExoP